MSAQLDSTLVWIAFSNPYVLTITFLVIDMVQLLSEWSSQQCTFFHPSLLSSNSWLSSTFCRLYGGTWAYRFHVWICSDPTPTGILPVSCVQALYYYTHQNDGWYLKLSVRSSIQISIHDFLWVILYTKVTAVVIFDTVHQALITHTSGCLISICFARH